MNGSDIKKAAISKAKQVATAANNAANGNGGKKRRKGQDLKPIITTEDQQSAGSSPASAAKMNSSGSVEAVNITTSRHSINPLPQPQQYQLSLIPPQSPTEPIVLLVVITG